MNTVYLETSRSSGFDGFNSPTGLNQHNFDGNQISDELKVAVSIALDNFNESQDSRELEFPSSFDENERLYICKISKNYGFLHETRGKGVKKYLIVKKHSNSIITFNDAKINLKDESKNLIKNLLDSYELSVKERQELWPKIQSKENIHQVATQPFTRLQVPHARNQSFLDRIRLSLPIYSHKDEILNLITMNRVVMITGVRGSGKSTQIAQFLLDHHSSTNKACRIVQLVSTNLAALNISSRIALERDEELGQTIGYKLKYKNNISAQTVLILSTYDIFLKSLNATLIGSLSYIILDDMSERDTHAEFVLIYLKDLITKFKHLKLILLGSNSYTNDNLLKYFTFCQLIQISSTTNVVHEHFLEDILKLTNYNKGSFQDINNSAIDKWISCLNELNGTNESQCNDLNDFDKLLFTSWSQKSPEYLKQVVNLIKANKLNVDYQHSQTLITPLIIASAKGLLEIVEILLVLRADLQLKSSNAMNAYEWARKYSRSEVIHFLECYNDDQKIIQQEESSANSSIKSYYQSNHPHIVNLELIKLLICYIFKTFKDTNSILVYLSCSIEIFELKNIILSTKELINSKSKCFELFEIDSDTTIDEFQAIYKTTKPGIRKIILAAVDKTIPYFDPGFVIDCGLIVQKHYDNMNNITKITRKEVPKFISKQRKYQLVNVNTGYFFSLIPKSQLKTQMTAFVPEFQRNPLHESCLIAKSCAPKNTSIADFISKAIEVPHFSQIRNAINHLKTMDLLDTWEDLTELGYHLVNFPIELKYGKMILYSIVLKCFDPILIITSALSVNEPIFTAKTAYEKREVDSKMLKYSQNSDSDHYALYNLFNAWYESKIGNTEKIFCHENHVSSKALNKILLKKNQLLEHLKYSWALNDDHLDNINSNSDKLCLIKAALVAGSFPHIVRFDNQNNIFIAEYSLCSNNFLLKSEYAFNIYLRNEQRIIIHNSSVIYLTNYQKQQNVKIENLASEWLLYNEMSQHGNLKCLKCCTLVSPLCIAIFSGNLKLNEKYLNELDTYKLNVEVKESLLKTDVLIQFKSTNYDSSLILNLRQKWNCLFLRGIKNILKNEWTNEDHMVLETLLNVILNE